MLSAELWRNVCHPNSSALLSEWEEQHKDQNSLKGQMTVPYWGFLILLIPRIGDFICCCSLQGTMERFFLEAGPVLLKAEFCRYWCLSVPSKEAPCLEVVLYYSVFCIVIFLAVKCIGEQKCKV